MGIKFYCPNGHKLNVKSFLAGKTGICPHCNTKVAIPLESQIPSKSAPGASAILTTPGGEDPQKHSAPQNVAPQPEAPAAQAPDAQAQAAQAPAEAPPQAQPAAAQPVAQPAAVQPHPAAAQPMGPSPAQPAAPGNGYPPQSPGAPHVPSAPDDPISEAPAAVWYVRPPTGGQYGPAAGDIMRRWLGEGRVTAASYVWREGWPDWQKATEVFPSLGPAAPMNNGAYSGSGSKTRTVRPRRKNNALAITAVIVLALAVIAALAALVYVVAK